MTRYREMKGNTTSNHGAAANRKAASEENSDMLRMATQVSKNT